MEDDQQFCLRWNNHQSTLIQNFDTLLESGTLVDCTLAAEGQYLKAHKVVLSACSPYFEGLLSEHYDKHPVFILKDVKFKELKAMMDYMYRGEVNISQDQLAALLKAAESLQIKGLSESKTGVKAETKQQKVAPFVVSQPMSLDIPHASSGLTIEKNKVPKPGMAQGSAGDLPEDSASPLVSKGLSSREGSQSPTSRKKKKFRRRSVGEDNSVENHEASNSSDMPQQMGVPALGIAPVADEKAHADPTDNLGRSALMTQLTKPADEMLQLPLEKPEPNDNLIEPKSEYLEDPEDSVEDLTLDEDMNDLNEMEQDNNRAGPSHDPSQHPAGLSVWHVPGDRSNAGGVVGSVAGTPGTTDEVFLAAQEAAQAHRDSQGPGSSRMLRRRKVEQQRIDAPKKKENQFVSSGSSEGSPKTESPDTSFNSCDDWLDWKTLKKLQEHQQQRSPVQRYPLARNQAQRNQAQRDQDQRNPLAQNQAQQSQAKRKLVSPNPVQQAKKPSSSAQPDDKQLTKDLLEQGPSKPTLIDLEEDCTDTKIVEINRDSNLPVGTFSCRYCKKTFQRMSHMNTHERRTCLQNPDSICNRTEANKGHSCQDCGRNFSLRKFLTHHMKHECNRTTTCRNCGKVYTGNKIPGFHRAKCRSPKTSLPFQGSLTQSSSPDALNIEDSE